MKIYPHPLGDRKIKWISTEWLVQHIDDESLNVLDVRPNVHDYIIGHLPNAIYLNEGPMRSDWDCLGEKLL